MKIIEGDIFELIENEEFDYVAHGCNCFCVQKAGIAKLFSEKYNTDKGYLEGPAFKGFISKLGNYDLVKATTKSGKKFEIANCYTQYETGPNAMYSALELSLYKLFYYIKITNPYAKIGLPLIGAGIGQLNQDFVIDIMNDLTDHFQLNVTLVMFNKQTL